MRQLMALSDRWEQDQERQDFRCAQTTAMLYNINRGKGKSAKSPKDFMLSKFKKETNQKIDLTDKDQSFDVMLKLAKSQGANIVER